VHIRNICTNLALSTGNGGLVIARSSDHSLKSVPATRKDTGSGIDPEIFSRLFTKFTSRSFSGTGLGLYISKNIIEAHGGKIWAQNNNEHRKRGATFYFTLPPAT
jgi:signal transduction histidine kinase